MPHPHPPPPTRVPAPAWFSCRDLSSCSIYMRSWGLLKVRGREPEAYRDCPGAEAGTAVSILLTPLESKWQSGAWNLVCGSQASVLQPALPLCAWGLTPGRQRTKGACLPCSLPGWVPPR